MPWSSVSDFKTSQTYKHTKEMHAWSEARIKKYIATFSAVFARMERQGADKHHIEATAHAIAFSAAKHAAADVHASLIEDQVHYFAPFVPEMLGIDTATGGLNGEVHDLTWASENIDVVREAVKNVQFNYEHDASLPLGVIRDVILTKDAPPEVAAKVDKDVPFLYKASYFAGVPTEVRTEQRISPEWHTVATSKGNSVMPHSFAVTPTPLNGPETGIVRIANTSGATTSNTGPFTVTINGQPADYVISSTGNITVSSTLDAKAREKLGAEDFACPEDRSFPIHDAEHVRAAMSRFHQPHTSKCSDATIHANIMAAAKKFGVDMAEMHSGLANPNKGQAESGVSSGSPPMANETPPATAPTADLAAKVASLSADLAKEQVAHKEDALKLAATVTELSAVKAEVAALKAAALDASANEFALGLVREGKAVSEKAAYFAGLYKTMGKEAAEELAKNLPVTTVGVAGSKAAGAPVKMEDSHREAIKTQVASILKAGV